MIVVEVGFKLNENIKYYEEILSSHNAINRFNCKTHDIYWTNKNLENMTENEMKNSCIRLRITEGFGGVDFSGVSKISYRFQNADNFIVNKDNQKELTLEEVNERISKNLVNNNEEPQTKTIKEIIKGNVFTYFNFLNILK